MRCVIRRERERCGVVLCVMRERERVCFGASV